MGYFAGGGLELERARERRVFLTNGYDQDDATPRKANCKIQIHQKILKPELQGRIGMSGSVWALYNAVAQMGIVDGCAVRTEWCTLPRSMLTSPVALFGVS